MAAVDDHKNPFSTPGGFHRANEERITVAAVAAAVDDDDRESMFDGVTAGRGQFVRQPPYMSKHQGNAPGFNPSEPLWQQDGDARKCPGNDQ